VNIGSSSLSHNRAFAGNK